MLRDPSVEKESSLQGLFPPLCHMFALALALAFTICCRIWKYPKNIAAAKEGSPIPMPTPKAILSDTLSPELEAVPSPLTVMTGTTSTVLLVIVATAPLAEVVT